MVQIATDPEASLELRGRMNAELAQYVYPKRKAVEVATDQDAPPIHRVDHSRPTQIRRTAAFSLALKGPSLIRIA
jgi:hypothetical protein